MYELSDDSEQLPCHGKLAFDTRKQGEAAATVALHQHGARLKAYQCRYCGL